MADIARPAPLVAADVDLTDFPFMPIMIARLKQSRAWLLCKRKPELAFYMLNLWTAAWHGRPAASLENDDDVLADLAMCEPRGWKKIKAEVLRGWVECTDGRLYHPVVAEQAMVAWARKMAQRGRTEAARLARLTKRQSQNAEGSVTSDVTASVTKPATEALTVSVTDDVADTVTSSKGQGQGQGQGQRKKDPALPGGIPIPAEDDDPFGPKPTGHGGTTDPPEACARADPSTAKRELFARGEAVLGSKSGGQVTQLLRAKGGNVALARAALETASTAHKPRDYVAGVINGSGSGLPAGQLYDRGL